MNSIRRILDLHPIIQAKSCFLFGPRQTGKTSLLGAQFPQATVIDLLDEELFIRLQTRPTELAQILPKSGVVVIDEIQRIPQLLNEVHRQIEQNRALRFVLTGSSARKLRRRGVNLLGGRARSRHLHPFVWAELRDAFDLNRVLLHGALPSVFFSDRPREDIKSYVGDYLKVEIAAEAVTRNLPAFTRFLEVAAITNGQILNYQKISNDSQVKRSTVQNYYEILRDTLIGTELEAYRKTRSRKATATSKFYFFDLGMVNYLKRVREIPERTSIFGESLEAYLHHELRAWVDYHGDGELQYWRSSTGRHEVDFILNEEIAIECRSTRAVDSGDLKGLVALGEELRLKRRILVCMESRKRVVSGVEIIPLQEFLSELWDDDLRAKN
jgi:predicted AAA+ superfamily ATPase